MRRHLRQPRLLKKHIVAALIAPMFLMAVKLQRGRPTKMSPGLAKAIENLAFECACVVGHVELGSDPRGGTYAYFTHASAAYKIAEPKCSSGGL